MRRKRREGSCCSGPPATPKKFSRSLSPDVQGSSQAHLDQLSDGNSLLFTLQSIIRISHAIPGSICMKPVQCRFSEHGVILGERLSPKRKYYPTTLSTHPFHVGFSGSFPEECLGIEILSTDTPRMSVGRWVMPIFPSAQAHFMQHYGFQ